MRVMIEQAAEAHYQALRNLFQLYRYDLSPIHQNPPDADGRFDQADLDLRLQQAGVAWFVIRYDATLAGFAAVTRSSRLNQPYDGHAVSEFFVLRALRRKTIGSRAAVLLFDQLPGHWEVATPANNTVATAFWRAVADRYSNGAYQELWLQRDGWRGNIERFSSPGGLPHAAHPA
ncbi:MAG TPA: GNAT family N-acetyltransferase [Roseiflexaceae bacterium]|nr:GNAT family N-acetyltransferase [Roseiflexaceae bacterium]HMP39138.1 GNAT family N-acetyltransferase [Roseiflexaceae bacterium]